MAGEERYYNPIIEAMIASAQMREKVASRMQENERAKAELALKETQEKNLRKYQDEMLRQGQLKIDQEHQYQMGMLSASQKAQEASALHSRAETFRQLGEAVTGKVMPEETAVSAFHELFKNMPPPSPVSANYGPIPGMTQQFPISRPGQIVREQTPGSDVIGQKPGSFFSPEARMQFLENIARSEARGKAEGALPSRLTELERETEWKSALERSKETFEASQNALNRGLQERLNAATNQAHLQGIQLGKSFGNPEDLKKAISMGYTGQLPGKLDIQNPIDRQVIMGINAMGGQAVDQKEIQTLKGMQNLLPVFDRMKEFEKKLYSTKAGALFQTGVQGLANMIGVPTDIQNEYNQIRADAIRIGTSLEGMSGRPLAKQVEADFNSLIRPGMTKKQADDAINAMKQRYFTQQEDVVMAGKSPEQRDAIRKAHGIKSAAELFDSGTAAATPTPNAGDPDWLKLAPATNRLGHKLDRDASIQMRRPVYAQ